jgi:cytochrome c oxidase assembly protein subunit 15
VLGAFTLPGAPRRLRRFTLALLTVELAQIAVGITQARTGLPEVLVGLHMVLAGVLVAAMTAVVLSLRESGYVPLSAIEDDAVAPVGATLN